jgi:hypothetical protein
VAGPFSRRWPNSKGTAVSTNPAKNHCDLRRADACVGRGKPRPYKACLVAAMGRAFLRCQGDVKWIRLILAKNI